MLFRSGIYGVVTLYGMIQDCRNLIVNELIIRIIGKNAYNVDRLQTVYEILGLSDNHYQSLVKKWAIQTIAILYNSDDTPVAAEGVLVLQGKQGIADFGQYLLKKLI